MVEDKILQLEKKFPITIREYSDDIVLFSKDKYWYKYNIYNLYKIDYNNLSVNNLTKESYIRWVNNTLKYKYIKVIDCTDDKNQLLLQHTKSKIEKWKNRYPLLGIDRISESDITKFIIKGEIKEQQIISNLGDYYDYSKLEYTGSTNKVTIICPIHGIWEVLPSNILYRNSSGCPKCTYDKKQFDKEGFIRLCGNNPGTLYIIQIYDDKETFYKVGITSRTVNKRFYSALPYKYKIIKEISGKASDIYSLEKELHNKLYKYCYHPSKYFSGHTECFTYIPDDIIGNLN